MCHEELLKEEARVAARLVIEIPRDGVIAKDLEKDEPVGGARQEAAPSMAQQAGQQLATAVVDRLWRLPNEVANAMAQPSIEKANES